MKRSNILRDGEFNFLPFMSSSGSHSEILQRIYERLNHMTQKHSQVYVLVLVVLYPSDHYECLDNSSFSRFLADFMRSLSKYDPSYVWVREECPESPGRFHFHLILMLDGNETQRSQKHLHSALYYWAKALTIQDATGLVHLCEPQSQLSFNNEGFKLVRNSPSFNDTFRETFHYLSYVAKTASKTPMEGVRTFGCSVLR